MNKKRLGLKSSVNFFILLKFKVEHANKLNMEFVDFFLITNHTH